MAEEVVQATSPLITEPTALSDEAMKAASLEDIMGAIDAASKAPSTPTTTPRRRGRPPGSKNKTPAQKLAAINPEAAKQAEDEAKRQAKKKRAEDIEKQIYGELNDQLMTVLIGSIGIPIDAIYLPGKGPVVLQKKDERFTEIGQKLAIPPGLARSIGKLASELEQTDVGSKVGAVAQNNNVGLIVASGMTIFGLVQYAKALNDTFSKIKPVLDARKRAQQMQQEEAQGNGQVPTDNQTARSGSVS